MSSTVIYPLPHRQFPDHEDINNHNLMQILKEQRPNSIRETALRFLDFLESTSTWNQIHIMAFRMLDFDDLPINYFYPYSYYPSIDDPVILEAAKLFKLSKDEIRHGKDCLRTSHATPSPPQIPARPQRQSQVIGGYHQYTTSDSSGSSYVPSSLASVEATSKKPVNEDKSETVTNVLLITYLYLLAELENESKTKLEEPRILFSASHDHFSVTIEGKSCGSENDGAAWRGRWSQSSRQWVKSGKVPLCSLECKRLDHGRSNFQILAQEGGELLAIQELKHAHDQIKSERDEEAFLICCHHSSLFITSAVIDVKYLESIRNGGLRDDQFMCIKRSIKFDLSDNEGIIDASRAVIGLLRYLLAK